MKVFEVYAVLGAVNVGNLRKRELKARDYPTFSLECELESQEERIESWGAGPAGRHLDRESQEERIESTKTTSPLCARSTRNLRKRELKARGLRAVHQSLSGVESQEERIERRSLSVQDELRHVTNLRKRELKVTREMISCALLSSESQEERIERTKEDANCAVCSTMESQEERIESRSLTLTSLGLGLRISGREN